MHWRQLGFGIAAIVAAAGCAAKPDGGAELKFVAPGLGGADELTIVLADPSASAPIAQRTTPSSLADANVIYYRQGVMTGALVDHFATLDGAVIELGGGDGPAASYVPFVLVGSIDAPTAIGTYTGGGTTPAAIAIPSGDSADIEQFSIELTATAPPNSDGTLPTDGYQLVSCQSATPGDPPGSSGFVWQPASGPELRVLVADDGDATARDLDLDCDGDAADDPTDPDCDDTRAMFYAGAAELCDGLDTNCDGALLPVATPCANPAGDPTCLTGVQFCADVAGMSPESTCYPAPSCGDNSYTCEVPDKNDANDPYAPCEDDLGSVGLDTYACSIATPCVVSVARTTNDWRVSLSPAEVGAAHGTEVHTITVTDPIVWIDVTQHGAATANTPLGEIDLAISHPGAAPELLGVILDVGVPATCGSPTQMSCVPTIVPTP